MCPTNYFVLVCTLVTTVHCCLSNVPLQCQLYFYSIFEARGEKTYFLLLRLEVIIHFKCKFQYWYKVYHPQWLGNTATESCWPEYFYTSSWSLILLLLLLLLAYFICRVSWIVTEHCFTPIFTVHCREKKQGMLFYFIFCLTLFYI